MKKWYNMTAKADKAEIWIYEQIGEDFWSGDGITAKSFQKDLASIKASQIDLHINSPGGEVFSGITIYNLLKQHPANVTTYIDGLAASIASVIAMAGNEIYMAENALMMIHNPWGMAMGDSTEMRKTADLLDKICESLIIAYTDKSKKKKEEVKCLMDEETWMTAEEAMEHGFIDDVTESMDLAACAKFIPIMSKAKFKHIPEALKEHKPIPTATDLERSLREAGCSIKQAKVVLSKGFAEAFRDVEPADPIDDVPPTDQLLRDVEVPAPVAVVEPIVIAEPVVDPPPIPAEAPKKKDRIADLLVRAEMLAPSK
jgi:ATP-dependent Clp endopeptidase proteolytic subunit ClpP